MRLGRTVGTKELLGVPQRAGLSLHAFLPRRDPSWASWWGAVCWPPPALDLPSVVPDRQPMAICCPVSEGLWETPSALEMSL